MPVLTSPQRRLLETVCVKGRRASELAVRAALAALAVGADRPAAHLDEADRRLRRGLRAKARQLGDTGDTFDLLAAECAYEQWHRLLFTRFLAETGLLIHPQYRAPVTIEDCEELAEALGEPDGWSVAARFAAEILPGIFRVDDPCVRLRLAPEGRLALEGIVAELPHEIFVGDDALGWVYQFWQKDKKDEVNASERKIGGADIGPVTQLFTEHYMVRFLLENSLGAWWASRHPSSPLVKSFDHLRRGDDGIPAAGSFDEWPDRAAEVTFMDPCCGSGHFLVDAFTMLWQMRVEEEGLSTVEAQDAVLRDNLFGLELDPRCVQIAMFAVAVQAWKSGGGWRELPVPNVACSGIPVKAPADDWKALADGDPAIENALVRLYILFRDADTLGSLIDPKRATELADPTQLQQSFDDVDWDEIAPLLDKAVRAESDDPALSVLGTDAAGTAKAARLLSLRYTVVATNVPYLGINKFGRVLRELVEREFPDAQQDLALVMMDRISRLADTSAIVTPSEWLHAPRVVDFRKTWLRSASGSLLARLGYGAFSAGVRANPLLVIVDQIAAPRGIGETIKFIDVSSIDRNAISSGLMSRSVDSISVRDVLSDKSVIIAPGLSRVSSLSEVAECRWGLSAGDGNRFERFFWEVPRLGRDWEYLQTSAEVMKEWTGRTLIVLWENESGQMAALAHSVRDRNHKAQQWRSGKPFWGKSGVAINAMGNLRSTLYSGDRFNANSMVIVPHSANDQQALWAFASTGELEREIRKVSQSLRISPGLVERVPFEVDRWRRIAAELFPTGLPDPCSDDPTQWLFTGRPEVSTAPLQVAVARLLAYRWPEQTETDDLDGYADADGIVCLPSVAGEAPAADRLQEILVAAYGMSWSPARTRELLDATGSQKESVAEWLRDEFFKQHCAQFGNRPFVWHIWDGRRDGFAALINYHRLNRANLEKLTYTYLGDWIERQQAAVNDDLPGAEARLVAAMSLRAALERILEGEAPYDIYVRWKSLSEQPIGWAPDLNDGVRVNVRPFVKASVLRSPFNVHWKKDRGTNPDGTERLNDLHVSNADKHAARGGST